MHGGVREPIPEVATVSWSDEQGRHFERRVEVASKVPKDLTDDLYFEIDGTNQVTVVVRPAPRFEGL